MVQSLTLQQMSSEAAGPELSKGLGLDTQGRHDLDDTISLLEVAKTDQNPLYNTTNTSPASENC